MSHIFTWSTKIFAIPPPPLTPAPRKGQQLTAMERIGCRDKVPAYAGGGVATNLMWEQVEYVFSYSDSVRRKMYDLIQKKIPYQQIWH